MSAEIVLPAPSGSELEAASLKRLAERLGGRCVGVVGDAPLWGVETILSAVSLVALALSAVGGLSDQAVRVEAALAATIALGQCLGVGVLDFLLPRRPTWAVVVGSVNASTGAVIAIPTDNPFPTLPLARAALVIVLAVAPWLPGPHPLLVASGMLGVLPASLLIRLKVPEVSVAYRLAADAGSGLPIVLCGGSQREGRGLVGALDWLRARRPVILWVAGTGDGVEMLPRLLPWRWTGRSARWLRKPALLKLVLRGYDVRLVGASGATGGLGAAVTASRAQLG